MVILQWFESSFAKSNNIFHKLMIPEIRVIFDKTLRVAIIPTWYVFDPSRVYEERKIHKIIVWEKQEAE